jgi:hypothetical protein
LSFGFKPLFLLAQTGRAPIRQFTIELMSTGIRCEGWMRT